MSDFAIHRLLVECGLRKMLWPPAGLKWGVVGELDGGARLVITCVPDGEQGYYLRVGTAAEREWLLEVLERHGASAPVRVGSLHAPEVATGPWFALAVGLGALTIFGWVLSTIVR